MPPPLLVHAAAPCCLLLLPPAVTRNFLGFAKEIFTDAGRYAVHFGYAPAQAAELASRTLAARSGQDSVVVTPLAQARTDVAVIPSVTGNQLVRQWRRRLRRPRQCSMRHARVLGWRDSRTRRDPLPVRSACARRSRPAQVVSRRLGLSEKMIALAAAISVDYNFFSRHSSGSGLFAPPLFMPVPGGGGGGGVAEGAAAGTAGAGGCAQLGTRPCSAA